MIRGAALALLVIAFGPDAAFGQTVEPTQVPQIPNLCATSSGLGTNTCVFPRGTAVVESSLIDWTLDTSDRVRDDTILVGQTMVRLGIAEGLEAQVGWTPFGHERVTNRATGQRYGSDSIGDVTLGFKKALIEASDDPLSIAVQPFVVLPTGRAPVGSGRIGGGAIVPIGYDLSPRTTFEIAPEVDLLGNQDGKERHLEYNLTVGVASAVLPQLYATAEYRFLRNADPLHKRTNHLAALSFAWQPSARLQLNAGAATGLTSESPRLELIVGFARRFR